MTTLKKQAAAKRTALSYCTLIVISLLFAALAVTLASCFSPWTGEEELTDAAGASPAGTGTVVVSIGAGSSGSASVSYIAAGKTAGGTLPAQSRAAWTDDDMLPWPPGVPLKSLRHDISLAGGTGGPQDATIPVGGGRAEFSGIEPGRWAITVRAYIPGSTPADDELVAMGQEEITVVAGPNPTATVQMDPLDPDPLTVTFDLNGGTAAPGAAPEPVTVGSGTEINLPTGTGLTRNGYTFAGWCVNSNGEGLFYTNKYTPADTITLYAKWMRNYTVTFDSNLATIAANPASMTVIHPATTVGTLPTAPERTGGYTFTGWKTAGGEPFTAATVVTADITVVAQWELVTNPVTGVAIVAPIPGLVEQGGTLQFGVTITYADTTTSTDVTLVTWEVSGNTRNGTTIDTNGILHVAADETVDTRLSIRATDKNNLIPPIYNGVTAVSVVTGAPPIGILDHRPNGGGVPWAPAISDVADLAQVVTHVNANPTGEYRLMLSGDITSAAPQEEFASGVKLEIVGNGGVKTITFSGASDSLFTVGAGATLTLNNDIILHGNENNATAALVFVDGEGGELIMNANSTITMHKGRGIDLKNGGKFTMNNGEISGNKDGGVILAYNNDFASPIETFTMYDGVIKDNTTGDGGGVYVGRGAIFDMQGGFIQGNNASIGGGVYLSALGRFEMSGGEIKDNHATGNGGGVSVWMGSMSKSGGGTIYGSDAAVGLRNTAGGEGQAVFRPSTDTTLYPGDNM